MPLSIRSERIVELVRYYQAGIVNTLFGLGAYSALLWAGLGIYPAQLVSHLMGMAFNYFTYSRHVFRQAEPAYGRFLLSYGVNYVISLLVLAAVAQVIANPYAAGFVTAVIVSVINYFVLKSFVFRKLAP
jgi:putative flippase GtrA